MISSIGMTSPRTQARMIERLREQGIRSEEVLRAITLIPRHHFVEEALSSRAYDDTALPLGYQQTISQPYVVARMIELAIEGKPASESKPLGKILEVGAGCGYFVAVASLLAQEVYGVERILPLLERARRNIRTMPRHPNNIRFQHGDGMLGLPAAAPYDTIIVSAGTQNTPPALLEQLAPQGRLVIPLGSPEQQLCVISQAPNKSFHTRTYEAVRFVPLIPGEQS